MNLVWAYYKNGWCFYRPEEKRGSLLMFWFLNCSCPSHPPSVHVLWRLSFRLTVRYCGNSHQLCILTFKTDQSCEELLSQTDASYQSKDTAWVILKVSSGTQTTVFNIRYAKKMAIYVNGSLCFLPPHASLEKCSLTSNVRNETISN